MNKEEIRKIAFYEGFNGVPAREISIGYDDQVIYFDLYREGKRHRTDVEDLCKKENIDLIELMIRAITLYRKTNYE